MKKTAMGCEHALVDGWHVMDAAVHERFSQPAPRVWRLRDPLLAFRPQPGASATLPDEVLPGAGALAAVPANVLRYGRGCVEHSARAQLG